MPDFSYERAALEAGYQLVCGIDEAGRGPLSGPVVAAACILPLDVEIPGLNDSKKISPKKREKLFDKVSDSEYIWLGNDEISGDMVIEVID